MVKILILKIILQTGMTKSIEIYHFNLKNLFYYKWNIVEN